MKTKKTEFAHRQTQTRSAKNRPQYNQLIPYASLQVLKALKEKGYLSHSPEFAAEVSLQIAGGEQSQEYQRLLLDQGQEFQDWTEFMKSGSVEQVERWKRGHSVSKTLHIAGCKAFEKATGTRFLIEDVSAIDPSPYFDAIKAATAQRIAASRNIVMGQSNLLSHPTAGNILHSRYQVGVWISVKSTNITLSEVPSSYPLREFQIQVAFRDVLIPIGYVVICGFMEYESIIDPRPFIWLGQDFWLGRKLIRLIKLCGDVEAQVERLIRLHLSAGAIAS